MNVLSCFDGMGCTRIALDRLGISVNNYYAAEIDKYAMQIAAKNYPDIQHVGDITKLNASDFEEPIDLIIGGSPCQGFSFAGKQLNFDDPRSKLFFDFVWLYYELKPKYFLLENVRMKQECQDVISKYLGVEPIAINSSLVSAQNRHRLYWTNLPFDKLPEDKGIMLRDILLDDAQEPMLSNIYGGFGEKKPRVHYDKSVTIRTASGGGHIPSVCCAMRGRYNEDGSTSQRLECRNDGKTNALTTVTKDNYVVKDMLHSQKSIDYMEKGNDKWMQLGKSRADRYTQTPDKEKAFTLTANFYKGVPYNYFEDTRLPKPNIRKLHPIECERLQTVPDNYTEGVSNSQRYKMLGNGFTVDVICHLLRGLKQPLSSTSQYHHQNYYQLSLV